MTRNGKKLALVALGVFFSFTMAGVIFGYAPLKAALIGEGVYRERCVVGGDLPNNKTRIQNGGNPPQMNIETKSTIDFTGDCTGDRDETADPIHNGDDNPEACAEQTLRLDWMFTVATTATNAAALPIGLVLDRWGPKISCAIGAVLFLLGGTGFAIADSQRAFLLSEISCI